MLTDGFILINLIFLGLIIGSFKKKKDNLCYFLFSCIYFIDLFWLVFKRESVYEDNFKLDFSYLDKWLDVLFTNKTVFMNMIGNILLFIPLPIILRQKFTILLTLFLSFCVIIFIELVQGIFRIGVFDVLDILLNLIGVLIGLFCYFILNLR